MELEFVAVSLLNGIAYGLLLFMLSAGFTLIYGTMGVLNFAHASFYMLGAYVAYAVSRAAGFWVALVVAPVAVGAFGALFERGVLRRVQRFGHVAEVLATFGLSLVVGEAVQLVWGRVAVDFRPPSALRGPAFTAFGAPFPATRALMAAVAVAMLAALGLLARTRIGLVIRAARTHPATVEALGHDVPRARMGVFGAGCGLAALAGAVGGSTFVTEPAMATTVGSVVFVVVVVGGVGSLAGAFVASLAVGVAQTFAVGIDVPLFGALTFAQAAPLVPYLLMIAVLVVRPQGFLGAGAR